MVRGPRAEELNHTPRPTLYFNMSVCMIYTIIWIDAAGIAHAWRTNSLQAAVNLYQDLQQQMREHRVRYAELAEQVFPVAA